MNRLNVTITSVLTIGLLCVSCLTTVRSVDLKVPLECVARHGTVAEPYTKTGWAKEIIHKKTGIELVYIPAGTFIMGSPIGEDIMSGSEPQHRVMISKEFYLGKDEVTQQQWQYLMKNNPSCFKGKKYPVESVSWKECVEFCKKSGKGVRLPTEAEWEYACRAGTTGKYGGTGDLKEMGWFVGNNNYHQRLGGMKKPNAWGLYDMHGNVAEWCADFWGKYPTKDVVDPKGPPVAPINRRVIRGGDAHGSAAICRSASRANYSTDGYKECDDQSYICVGFRVVINATLAEGD